DTVASMVVWQEGRMRKGDYRKFIIKSVAGVDDFASMREAVERRYRRLLEEKKALPGLILIDGGIGQLHAAAQALEKLEIINQPVASIAKREEIIYVLGQEDDPVILERHSPILHLVQQIRDETHRFAVGFHRQRRSARTLRSELTDIAGVGERTAQKLLRRFGSITRLREASEAELAKVVSQTQAASIAKHFQAEHSESKRLGAGQSGGDAANRPIAPASESE
ncbi:MAG: helix-hairpin-helix domain-containing protein, partial [Bryobacteraceae bacterium]